MANPIKTVVVGRDVPFGGQSIPIARHDNVERLLRLIIKKVPKVHEEPAPNHRSREPYGFD